MLNDMQVVTPGSIAYAALMVRDSFRIDKLLLMPSKFRHCISSLDDWRTEDDLFKREDFFDTMVSFLNDPEDEWVKDTMNWWNR
jgi:hypothetical protein